MHEAGEEASQWWDQEKLGKGSDGCINVCDACRLIHYEQILKYIGYVNFTETGKIGIK